jgi:ketosteroid isomerase-like protein
MDSTGSDTRTEILNLGERWAEAERNADTDTLDDLAAAGFRLVGPFGFVLDKAQWLARYQTGALHTSSLVWDEVDVREYGDTAVAIGRHTQRAAYQGRAADGQFRATHVFTREGDGWMLVSQHLSQAAPPSGRPG